MQATFIYEYMFTGKYQKTKKNTTKHFFQSLLSINIVSLLQPSPPLPNATSRASNTVRTKTNCISLRISSATSCSTSLRFAHGRMTFLICARWAPNLLFDPTHRSDPSTKGDLSSHGNVPRDACTRKQRHKRAYHRNTGTGTILFLGTSR